MKVRTKALRFSHTARVSSPHQKQQKSSRGQKYLNCMCLITLQAQEKICNFMDLDFKTIGELGKTGVTVIVPMIQVESHGVHLPVGTDYYCTIEIAKWTAKKCDSLVSVPITFGNCVPFASWPGYVIIDTQTLNALIKQYLESLHRQGFRKVVFLIMHGGDNFYGIKLAVDEYHIQNQDMSVAITYVNLLLGKEGMKLLGEGKDIDTSIMLHVRPDLVHMEKLEDAQENRPQPQTKGRAVWYAKGKDLAYYSPDNYRDSSNSSAELGEKLLNVLSDNLVEIIQNMD